MSFEFYISIKGKSQKQFKPETKKAGRSEKHIPCIKFFMSSQVPVDANSGEAKGHRQHKPLIVTKEWGAASPQILQAHWTNEVLDEVVIDVVGRDKDGKREIVVEQIKLTDAVITSVERYSSASAKATVDTDVQHLEDIGFRFRKIEVENKEAGTATSDDWLTPGS
ncbi:type VI secretion system tube protein TssD [Pendulispora albinea]|uniref:Type VI secretion system tube protein Hcp n=1 Tax=Pendulispora albinea TaxID=2741071 RepID=A0ABZ2LU40_9BACT